MFSMVTLVDRRVGQQSSTLDNNLHKYTNIHKFVGGPRASEKFTSLCGVMEMNIVVGKVNSE